MSGINGNPVFGGVDEDVASSGGDDIPYYEIKPYNGPTVRGGYAPIAGSYGVPIRLVQALYGAAASGMAISNILKVQTSFGDIPLYEEIGEEWTGDKYSNFDNNNFFNDGPGVPEWLKWVTWIGGGLGAGNELRKNWPTPLIPQPTPESQDPIIIPYRIDYMDNTP